MILLQFWHLCVPLNHCLCKHYGSIGCIYVCRRRCVGVVCVWCLFRLVWARVHACVNTCSHVNSSMRTKQHSPPERPRSCIVRGLWGSGWCARSCESPGWWSSALPRPETPARSPAPWRTHPGAAAASDPAPLTRTYNSIASNQWQVPQNMRYSVQETGS